MYFSHLARLKYIFPAICVCLCAWMCIWQKCTAHSSCSFSAAHVCEYFRRINRFSPVTQSRPCSVPSYILIHACGNVRCVFLTLTRPPFILCGEILFAACFLLAASSPLLSLFVHHVQGSSAKRSKEVRLELWEDICTLGCAHPLRLNNLYLHF